MGFDGAVLGHDRVVFAICALVAFAVGLILRLTDAGSGHVADPWTWTLLGLALLAAHQVSPAVPWRRQ